MKKAKTTPQNETLTDILKLLTKRIEEATVDIHDMRRDLKFVNLRLGNVETDTRITKVDVEKLRGEIGEIKNELRKTEDRLHTRITYVGDLITIELGKKINNHEKRLGRLERTRAIA